MKKSKVEKKVKKAVRKSGMTFGEKLLKMLVVEPEFIYFDEAEKGTYTSLVVG